MRTNWSEGMGVSAIVWMLVGSSWIGGCGGSQDPAPAEKSSPPVAQQAAVATAPTRQAEPAATKPPKQERAASEEATAPAQKPAEAPPAKPAAPKPPQIDLGELLVTRDLWPPKVALTTPMTIAPGVTLPVGHELSLYEFNGGDIVLDDGEEIFECPASSTDVVERASAIKAKLTPEQLALNDNTIASHPELWPVSVTMTRRMQFQNGALVPVGREVTVRSVRIGWANLYDRELADHFQAEIFETDLIARARERMLLPESERTSFLSRSIAAVLEPSASSGDASLEQADYLLVYRARKGCTRCSAFAPELAKFYERVKKEHPNFEAVFYSDDSSAENARALVASEKLPGRAIAFDRRLEAADLAHSQTGQLLPLVYLYDKSGNRIANNHPNGASPSATDILALLETKLKQGQ
jgi:hypothetical protein